MPKKKRKAGTRRNAANPSARSRRGSRGRTHRKAAGRMKRKSRRRIRRNPSPLKMLGLSDINLVDVTGGTAIAIGSRLLPSFLSTKFKLPTSGAVGYLVQLGSGLGISWLVENFAKQKGIAKMGRLFTISNVLTRVADDVIFKGMTLGSLLGNGYPPGAYERLVPVRRNARLLGQYKSDTPGAYAGGFRGQFEEGPRVMRFQPRF